jgi:hypothetical protein
MKKIIVFIILLFLTLSTWVDADVPVASRLWTYTNLNLHLSKSTSWMVMAGFRYEFSRKEQGVDPKEMYFYEFFTGPMFYTGIWKLKIILPIWYYYMGFPIKADDTYTYSHNLELMPIFVYKTGNLIIYNRFIFHNTLYSSFYGKIMDNSDWENGYSLLLRWKLMFQYILSSKIILELANEPFYGLVEDHKMPPVTGPGFSEQGIDMNRVYAGLIYKVSPVFSIEVNYIYETSYAENAEEEKKLTQIAHYIFLNLKTSLKLY